MKLPRWRLFPKYATLIIAVVAGVLVVSGAINLVFSWREIQAHLVALQMEKAQGAATRIEQYVLDIEHQIGWTAFIRTDPSIDADRTAPHRVPEAAQAGAGDHRAGVDRPRRPRAVARCRAWRWSTTGAGTDLSKEPAFIAARGRQDLVRAGAVSQGHRAVHGDRAAGGRRRRRHGGRRQPEVRVGRGVAHQDRPERPGLRGRRHRHADRAPRHQPGAEEDRHEGAAAGGRARRGPTAPAMSTRTTCPARRCSRPTRAFRRSTGRCSSRRRAPRRWRR